MRASLLFGFCAVALAGAFAPQTAQGYSSSRSFADDPVTGGGGGRYFTGTARDRYTCKVCHVGAAPPTIRVDGLPAGSIVLGETYTIAITSDRAPVEIIAEVADPSGAGVGTITRLPDEMLDETDLCESGLPAATLVDEPTRTIAAITPCGSSRLRFEWTAPTLAAQGIVLHVAAVVSDESEDPTGDGVFAAEYALVEQETEERANVGACSVTGRTGQSELARWLVLILLAAPAMRRAKTRRNRC